MSPEPDLAWLEAIALSEGPPDEVVQAGGVAVAVRRRRVVEVSDLTDEEMALILASEVPEALPSP